MIAVLCRSWIGQVRQRQPCFPRPTPQAPAGTPRTPPTTCMSHPMGPMVPGSSATGTMTGTALALTLQLTPLVRRFTPTFAVSFRHAAARPVHALLCFCVGHSCCWKITPLPGQALFCKYCLTLISMIPCQMGILPGACAIPRPVLLIEESTLHCKTQHFQHCCSSF